MKKIFVVLVLVIAFVCGTQNVFAAPRSCGDAYYPGDTCSCPSGVTGNSGGQIACCGWMFDGQCVSKETFACGQSWDASRTDATCAPACPANGTYIQSNTVYACCGYVYNNSCHLSPARVVSCGSGYATDDSGATCNSSCPANGTYTDPTDNTIKYCCGYVFDGACSAIPKIATCGNVYQTAVQCPASCPARPINQPGGGTITCCGWINAQGACQADEPTSTDTPPIPTNPPGNGGGGNADPNGLTNATFDNFNSAIFGSGGPDAQLKTPRGIISRLLPYLFTFGGLILFLMILWGGFEMLTGAAEPKMQEAGKQRITAAVVGFLLLFASYWLAQIVQAIFGISIL